MHIAEDDRLSLKSGLCPCCTPDLDPEACPCSTGISGKFLEPVLILLLSQGQAHGYELLSQLDDFRVSADTSALYRTLRSLEDHGFVHSHWDTDRSGPARRCYSLTDKGAEYLESWVATVRKDRERLDRFLTAYHEGICEGGFSLSSKKEK